GPRWGDRRTGGWFGRRGGAWGGWWAHGRTGDRVERARDQRRGRPVRLLVVGVAACWFAGVTLLLDQLRWFRRRRLRDRLAPYVPGGAATGRGVRPAITSFRQVIGPLAAAVGERVARAVGVGEPLAVRLER